MVTNFILITILILGLSYGLWGTYVVFNKEYAKGVGDKLRGAFSTTSTGGLDEQIFDRLGRGLPAMIIGFALAAYCARVLFLG